MDNLETLEIIAIQGTGRRQSKNQYKQQKNPKKNTKTQQKQHTHIEHRALI